MNKPSNPLPVTWEEATMNLRPSLSTSRMNELFLPVRVALLAALMAASLALPALPTLANESC